MKKLLILTVILAFVAMSASAQVSKPFNIYVGGGLSMPISPDGFKDAYKSGFHGMGAIGYNAGPGFQLMGKIEYHKFSLDIDNPLASIFDMNFFMFGAAGKYAIGLPAAPIKPFVLGGAGFANISLSGGDNSITEFYFEFGGGAEFKLGPAMNLFVMAKYVNVATSDLWVSGDATAFIPITVGLKF